MKKKEKRDRLVCVKLPQNIESKRGVVLAGNILFWGNKMFVWRFSFVLEGKFRGACGNNPLAKPFFRSKKNNKNVGRTRTKYSYAYLFCIPRLHSICPTVYSSYPPQKREGPHGPKQYISPFAHREKGRRRNIINPSSFMAYSRKCFF